MKYLVLGILLSLIVMSSACDDDEPDNEPEEFLIDHEPICYCSQEIASQGCGVACLKMWMDVLCQKNTYKKNCYVNPSCTEEDSVPSYYNIGDAIGYGPHENDVLAQYLITHGYIVAKADSIIDGTQKKQFNKVAKEIIDNDSPVIQSLRIQLDPYPTHNVLVIGVEKLDNDVTGIYILNPDEFGWGDEGWLREKDLDGSNDYSLLFQGVFRTGSKASGHIAINTIWGTNLPVTGDVVIDNGVTLTIKPGITVYFASQDDQAGGQDSTVPEIEVYGTLIADSAQFVISSENGKQYWRVETFGAEASATFTDCSIEHEDDLLFYSNSEFKSPLVNEERLVYTDNTDKIELPMVFKFSQNEPNPFFKSTSIKYQLPTKSKVSLRIYDITGRCVKTLINNEKEIGYYKVKLDAKEFSAGIYFMKFFATNGAKEIYKETKKLILLK